jgi:hypothetical protein
MSSKDRHVPVGAVADDQGYPRLGGGGSGEQQASRNGEQAKPVAPIEAQAHGSPRRNAVRGQGYSVVERLQLTGL